MIERQIHRQIHNSEDININCRTAVRLFNELKGCFNLRLDSKAELFGKNAGFYLWDETGTILGLNLLRLTNNFKEDFKNMVAYACFFTNQGNWLDGKPLEYTNRQKLLDVLTNYYGIDLANDIVNLKYKFKSGVNCYDC